MPTIMLSAGDVSGEAHAAALVRELRGRLPGARFVGLGGQEMAAAGVELLADSRTLAVGGLFEIGGSFGRIAATWRAMVKGLRELQPELVILIDSGGFNLPLARRARQLTKARVLYYVAPQLWAWRAGRLPKLVARTDRIAVLFPFERDFYSAQGIEVDYVGNPLLDSEFAEPIAPDAQREARRGLGLDLDRPVLALFPGSRRNEVARHLPIQLAAVARLREQHPALEALQAVIAVAPSLDREWVGEILRSAGEGLAAPNRSEPHGRVVLEEGGRSLIDAADAALTKPGTITVELMLRERPMVVMGRANPLTAAIVKRELRVPWLSMPNLIAGDPIVPELVQEASTPERIADALAPLLVASPGSQGGAAAAIPGKPSIPPAAREQVEALRRARERLGPPGATARVADLVSEMWVDHA